MTRRYFQHWYHVPRMLTSVADSGQSTWQAVNQRLSGMDRSVRVGSIHSLPAVRLDRTPGAGPGILEGGFRVP